MCVCGFIKDPTSWKHLSFWNCLAVPAKVTWVLCRPLKSSVELLSWNESPNSCVAFLRELFVFSCFPAPLCFRVDFTVDVNQPSTMSLRGTCRFAVGPRLCQFSNHSVRISPGIWADKRFAELLDLFLQLTAAACYMRCVGHRRPTGCGSDISPNGLLKHNGTGHKP